MVDPDRVAQQLKQIGADFRYWGRGEEREIHRVLMENETIQVAVMGRYSGGFAMLVATDQRMLLIDKKPLYLTLEDIRYDMVSEVDYRHQLVDATVHICTLNKELRFTSTRKNSLRLLTNYIQQRVTELRQYQQIFDQQAQTPQTLQAMPDMQPVQTVTMQQSQTAAGPTTHPADEPQPVPQTFQLAQQMNPYNRTPLIMRRRFSPFDTRSS